MENIRERINGVAQKVEATDRGIVRLAVLLDCFNQSESERSAHIRDLLAPFSSSGRTSASTTSSSSSASAHDAKQRERDEEAFGAWLLGVDLCEREESAMPETLGEDEEGAIDSLDAISPDIRFRLYLTWVPKLLKNSVQSIL